MVLLKCCTQYASKFGKISSGHRVGKSQLSFQSPKKAMPKNVQNYHTIAFISYTSEVMLKILQASLQRYVTKSFQMFKLALEKAKEPEIKLPASVGWIIEKAREFQKTSTSLH